MRSSILARILAAGVLLAGSAAAQDAPNSVAAREHLKDGFALRKAGQCAEALPHFLASFRLVPEPKALLNMADCEERLGQFIEAEEHWVQARVLSEARGNSPLAQEASERLAELAPRTPRLTIALASGAPPSARVLRDGVDFAPASLGVPLPCDAGRHTIEVRADGYEPKVFEVALSERDTTRIDVEPGPRWQPAELPVAPPWSSPRPDLARKPESAPPRPPVPSPARDSARAGRGATLYVGLATGTLGLVSFGFGAIEGLASNSDHQSALGACQGHCASSMTAQTDQLHAERAATLANVGFVAGGVFAATSAALLILAGISVPSARSAAVVRTPRLFVPVPAPLVGRNLRGIGLEAQW